MAAPRTTSSTVFGPRPTRPKEERIARAWDDDVHPLVGSRLGELRLRHVTPKPAAQVLEVGCRSGAVTTELARRFDAQTRIVAMDGSAALVDLARDRVAREHAADGGKKRVHFRVQPDGDKLPFADELYDVVVAELPLDARPELVAGVGDLARVCKPGGSIVIASLVRGSWQELLDLLDEVLHRRGRDETRAALASYVAAIPDAESIAQRCEQAGLRVVEIDLERWELLFRSARELLYAPVLDHGPLPRWKELVGKGVERQETFIALSETIETYFAGRTLAVGLVAACIAARKPL